jgi:hypothetical protein
VSTHSFPLNLAQSYAGLNASTPALMVPTRQLPTQVHNHAMTNHPQLCLLKPWLASRRTVARTFSLYKMQRVCLPFAVSHHSVVAQLGACLSRRLCARTHLSTGRAHLLHDSHGSEHFVLKRIRHQEQVKTTTSSLSIYIELFTYFARRPVAYLSPSTGSS